MLTPKSVLLFTSGCLVGVALTATLLSPTVKAQASGMVAGPFIDVPAIHIAARSVADLKSKGIVTGYPDDTYHGGRPVTRYEMAVTLARFAQYYDTSKAPLASNAVPLPSSPDWAAPSRSYLASNYFIAATSPMFANPGKAPVFADEFSDYISSVFNRITDRSMPLSHPQ